MACGACSAELAPSAKFCHRCGTPVGAPGVPVRDSAAPVARATSGASDAILWSVIAIALLALIAMVAGQRFARSGQSDGGNAAAADAAAPAMGAAPNISQMSPEERAQRLYDRMMAAFEHGHMDTVQMFAPMGLAAYQMLDSLTLDQRYDLGRLAEISGNPALAAVEADSILKADPTHLLGLILAAQAAHSNKDAAAERQYLDRLVKVAPAEQAKQLPEYQLHQNDIKAALDAARKR